MDIAVIICPASIEEKLETKAPKIQVDWKTWNPLRRRSRPGAIDDRTFAMLRGLEEKKFATAPKET